MWDEKWAVWGVGGLVVSYVSSSKMPPVRQDQVRHLIAEGGCALQTRPASKPITPFALVHGPLQEGAYAVAVVLPLPPKSL